MTRLSHVGRGEKYEGDWKEGKQTGQGKVPTAPPLSTNSSFLFRCPTALNPLSTNSSFFFRPATFHFLGVAVHLPRSVIALVQTLLVESRVDRGHKSLDSNPQTRIHEPGIPRVTWSDLAIYSPPIGFKAFLYRRVLGIRELVYLKNMRFWTILPLSSQTISFFTPVTGPRGP